jgi:hypothetical protein
MAKTYTVKFADQTYTNVKQDWLDWSNANRALYNAFQTTGDYGADYDNWMSHIDQMPADLEALGVDETDLSTRLVNEQFTINA